MIFFSGIALTMHMMHMMERLQNSTEKKYDCEIVLEQKSGDEGPVTIPYEVSWDDWAEILNDAEFGSVEYRA